MIGKLVIPPSLRVRTHIMGFPPTGGSPDMTTGTPNTMAPDAMSGKTSPFGGKGKPFGKKKSGKGAKASKGRSPSKGRR